MPETPKVSQARTDRTSTADARRYRSAVLRLKGANNGNPKALTVPCSVAVLVPGGRTGFRHEKQRPGVFHLQRNGRRVTVRHAISDSPKSEGRAHAMAPQEQRPQKERIASPLRRPSAFAFLGQ